MSENLKLRLATGSSVEASKNDGTTFSWTPTSCGAYQACAINGNTVYNSSTNNVYYSWYAATAGQGTSSSAGDVNDSICPKGWKLPYNYTISNAKSWQELSDDYSTTFTIGVPFSFTLPGHYDTPGVLESNGRVLTLWSSTASNTSYAYYGYYGTSAGFIPQSADTKYRGFSVRCVNI